MRKVGPVECRGYNDLAELVSASKRRRRWEYQGAFGPLICFISLQR